MSEIEPIQRGQFHCLRCADNQTMLICLHCDENPFERIQQLEQALANKNKDNAGIYCNNPNDHDTYDNSVESGMVYCRHCYKQIYP